MASAYLAAHPWEALGYIAVLMASYKAMIYIQRLYFHPLSKFPGPRICAASRVYEFYWDSVQHGRLWTKLPELHAKYGPIIRMGPDELHIQDSQYFTYLFSFKPLDKWAIAARQFGLRYAMFGTEEYKLYTQRRAAFGDAFSRSKTFKLQSLVNANIRKGCEQIESRTAHGQTIDLAFLYRAITAEIITEYMYGQNYSFFDDETTTKGLYDRRFDMIFGLTHLGRFIPWMIPIVLILVRSQINLLLGSHESTTSILGFKGFADKMLSKLIAEHGIQDQQNEKEYKVAAHQYIHSSLPKSDKTGDALSQATMAAWSGGWDTTAFALTQCSYYVMKHPHMHSKLRQELLDAWPDSKQEPTYNMLIRLPYLDAVVKESLRLMHGALSRLTRVNPLASEQYKDWNIPAGTKISMSLPNVNLDQSIWGEDSEQFRPDRWEGRPDLDNWLMTFSRGTRVCAGQELAWMELKMIIGTLFRHFDIEIEHTAQITDADVLPYSDGFTPGPKNYMQKLPVIARAHES